MNSTGSSAVVWAVVGALLLGVIGWLIFGELVWAVPFALMGAILAWSVPSMMGRGRSGGDGAV